MALENIQVRRVIVHEVFQRGDDRAIQPPIIAETLEELSPEAIAAFRLRMSDALVGHVQSLRMTISKHGNGSFLDLADAALEKDDAQFVLQSQAIANKLVDAQLSRGIPGGMVIVFDGQVGAPARPYIGVIKAETQAGFRRIRRDEREVLEFLQNIFLTPATRLYKIGLMVRMRDEARRPDDWQAHIFDSNIQRANREAAAAYFYESFLGCALPSDGPYETRKFFDLTKEFVRGADLDPEEKSNVIDDLFTFVREQGATFTTGEFADRHLSEELRDPYADYMRKKKFRDDAVVRDTTQMGGRLRRRHLSFGKEIELSASPDALAHKITWETIDGDEIDGHRPIWTRLTIKEALTGEQ